MAQAAGRPQELGPGGAIQAAAHLAVSTQYCRYLSRTRSVSKKLSAEICVRRLRPRVPVLRDLGSILVRPSHAAAEIAWGQRLPTYSNIKV